MTWRIQLRGARGALDVSIELETDARLVFVVGPNGAGKSSLIKTILGDETGIEGEIEVAGRVLANAATSVPIHQRALGYVPQGFALFPHLTVLENVAFGVREADADALALRALERVGAKELESRHPKQLSGGEKQRVALARAIASQPRALLLDEPLSALDPTSRRRLRRFLREYLEDLELPALVTTHDARDLAGTEAAIVVLERGGVVQVGREEELRECPATDFVREFFSE